MIDRILAFIVLCLVLGIPLGIAVTFTGNVMMNFVFFWPLFMSAIWISGGIYFWFYRERHWKIVDTEAPGLKGEPLISILIPCYNEGANVRETLKAALSQRYTNIEVIAINDGSTDSTADELNAMAKQHKALRIIHLKQNQGKATALQAGAAAANSDYLVCIDGDALLDRDAAVWLVKPMIDHPRVGAVTGNPRVRTRSTLVGRIQVGEFSSIIGLIKRTQRVYGQVFTVSGVVAAFNRRALVDVGYWSNDMITEDIDVSWKLQLHHWSIFFEPRAICWILMPETLRGLWRQRLRWAQGGAEVFSEKYAPTVVMGISSHVGIVRRILLFRYLVIYLCPVYHFIFPRHGDHITRKHSRLYVISPRVYGISTGCYLPAPIYCQFGD
ncbi:poly-beta-1,6-N-acetyl-D-glucosamine synthase [Xenorhabdus nematophila]|uniref:poly-beta-1,6-N-acetyl-D-glucosamine synthase n=1 Tax=Xenorhabdus nematophila TaxID=628 RepID=UPI000AEC8E61|nr:poly-beta-1,6-N-acetyl-D-glucosamine synthase [Xenorhabdus nematophila]